MLKLQREYNFYVQNKQKFLSEYHGKFIVIKDETIYGSYPSREIALKESIESLNLEMGTFLIQHVVTDDSEIVQRYHSRIDF